MRKTPRGWIQIGESRTRGVARIPLGLKPSRDSRATSQRDSPLWIQPLGVFRYMRPRQNGRHFPDAIFKCIFLNENVSISIKIPLKFVPKGPINNIPALVQIMAWHRSGDKPLSEPMMVSILTHICITRPQWVRAINKNMLSLFSNHNSQGPSNLHSIRLFLLFTKNYMPKVHLAMVFELLIKISKKYACFLC